jgi:hypothetical protein
VRDHGGGDPVKLAKVFERSYRHIVERSGPTATPRAVTCVVDLLIAN